MTEQELELLRLEMQVRARDVLLQWLVRRAVVAEGADASLAPALQLAADQDLHRRRQEFRGLTFAGVSAAESDLLAAEAQEAFDTALETVLAGLRALGAAN